MLLAIVQNRPSTSSEVNNKGIDRNGDITTFEVIDKDGTIVYPIDEAYNSFHNWVVKMHRNACSGADWVDHQYLSPSLNAYTLCLKDSPYLIATYLLHDKRSGHYHRVKYIIPFISRGRACTEIIRVDVTWSTELVQAIKLMDATINIPDLPSIIRQQLEKQHYIDYLPTASKSA